MQVSTANDKTLASARLLEYRLMQQLFKHVLLYTMHKLSERTKNHQYRKRLPDPQETLMPTNLPLWNGLDPAQRKVNRNSNDANDPNRLLIIRALVPEDDCEDDAAQIAGPARAARDDAVGIGMHVRHEAEDGAVGALEEECHAGHEAEHGALVVAVCEADGDLEGASDDGVDVHEVFLAPDARAGVDGVGQETADGAEGDVEETEHGGPATGAGLTEGFEVFEVVSAQDGINGQFGAEGAEVAAAGDEGL